MNALSTWSQTLTCPACQRIPLPWQRFSPFHDHCGCMYPFCHADGCSKEQQTPSGLCRGCAQRHDIRVGQCSLYFSRGLIKYLASELQCCRQELLLIGIIPDLLQLVMSYLGGTLNCPVFRISGIPYNPKGNRYRLSEHWSRFKTSEIKRYLEQTNLLAFAPPCHLILRQKDKSPMFWLDMD